MLNTTQNQTTATGDEAVQLFHQARIAEGLSEAAAVTKGAVALLTGVISPIAVSNTVHWLKMKTEGILLGTRFTISPPANDLSAQEIDPAFFEIHGFSFKRYATHITFEKYFSSELHRIFVFASTDCCPFSSREIGIEIDIRVPAATMEQLDGRDMELMILDCAKSAGALVTEAQLSALPEAACA